MVGLLISDEMKRLFNTLLIVCALTVISCTQEQFGPTNEITDHYIEVTPAAELTNLVKSAATWSTDRRFFDLEFSGDGVSLKTTLVGYEYYLAPGQYVVTAQASANIGDAIAEKTQVNGKDAESGFVTVLRDGNKYTVSAYLTPKNGEEEALKWSGTINFPADPAPEALSVVMSAQSNLGSGVSSVTMNLATDGISQEFDMTTYQTVWKGEGGYLAIDLYSDDGYLHDGQYTACAEGGVVNAGEFGIGYDTTVDWGWGPMEMKDWGTCWWTVSGGAATAAKITDGIITVSSRKDTVDDKEVTIWTIFWGKNYPQEYLFEGAIPALTKPEKPSGQVVPDYLYVDVVTPGDAVDTHAITITDKDNNIMAYLELLTEPGATDLSGSYPATSYASQPGQMRDGYDGGSMEYGGQTYSWPGGGSYYMAGGEQHYLYANSATVAVTEIATGAYNFTCEFFSYNAAGPDYVPAEGGDFDGTILTQVLVTNNYHAQYNNHLIAVELATDGITYTPADYSAGVWFATYAGDGNYLKLELYTEDGTFGEGTYTPCDVEGTVTPGTFNYGYTGQWGASGTTWYTITGGQASSSQAVTDGTVTIAKNGDEYTITLVSTVVNARYVGKLE